MEHASPIGIFFILLFGVSILRAIFRAKRGIVFEIRRIQGIAAIDEAVGRAVELGRPISFTTGMASVGPLLYAALGILHHISRRVARFGTKLFVPCIDPEVYVLTEASVQNAYRKEGRLNQYDSNSVRFLADEQFAYVSGYMGLVHRENVGSAFLFGSFAAESLILAEAGERIGAMQIAGTTSNEQIPFFVTTCDYTLLGEELFAAGAYFSDDPVQRGSLRGQDLCKLFIVAIIVCGALAATLLKLGILPEIMDPAKLIGLKWEHFNIWSGPGVG